ncbi:hypothetical protein OIO90_004018 [Microbotryomycetes sp. JL221]|nr:hypothetical protein OIO90_004018 [Microbotryomycetes sp. JL221]
MTGQIETLSNRCLVYKQHGDPKQVLHAHEYQLEPPRPGQVRVKFRLSAVNPADINVIQGVYPSKPPVRQDIASEPMTIMGNEATAEIIVVMGKGQLGTWQQYANLDPTDLTLLPSDKPISDIQAATLAINPPTALRMLSDFVPLDPSTTKKHNQQDEPKQWIIQNGANSAVGMSVIQIAKSWNVGTINLVRNRQDIDSLKQKLKKLGANHVLTYEEFLNKGTRQEIKHWLKHDELKLALNCVGGKETTEMVKLLDTNGFLVTYGGMAKTQLSLPPSLFIFKKLTATGFWLSDWSKQNPGPRQEMLNRLANLIHQGQFMEPDCEIVDLSSTDLNLNDMTVKVRKVMEQIENGRGKKFLFKM